MKRNHFNFFFKAPVYFGKQIAQGTKWLWLTFSTFIYRSFRFLKSSFQGILNILNVVIALLALFVGYEAMVLSQKAIQQSDEQFKRNSEESELQAQRAREQYDSAMVILSNYQKLSQQSLETSKKQAVTARRILDDQIYSGRPYISIAGIEILDTNRIISEIFMPKIVFHVANVGKRPGLNTTFRTATILPDMEKLRTTYRSVANEIESGAIKAMGYLPKIEKRYKEHFYIFFEIDYYDDITNQNFNQKYYYSYHKVRDQFEFYGCTSEEQEKIDNLVKLVHKNDNIYLRKIPTKSSLSDIK